MLKELVAPLIILQVIVFVVIIFFLRKMMYSASSEEIDRLKKLEAEYTRRTNDLAAKLDETERQLKARADLAEDEARRISEQAKADAEKVKEEALVKARQESERIVSQALSTKDKVKEDIESQMKDRCASISQDMIRKIFNSKHQQPVHEGFVNEIIEELERVEAGKLNVLSEKGELITPYEIDERTKEKIASIISKKSGKKISLSEKIDKSVIAGIVIKLGSLVIDGSLSGRLKDAYEG